jgi:hypothetical protein
MMAAWQRWGQLEQHVECGPRLSQREQRAHEREQQPRLPSCSSIHARSQLLKGNCPRNGKGIFVLARPNIVFR